MRAANERTQLSQRQRDSVKAPLDLDCDTIAEISNRVRQLLANVFALYVKLQSHEKRRLTKNFHWHMRRPDFCDYHLFLEECAEQIPDIAGASNVDRAPKSRNTLKAAPEPFNEPNDAATASLIEKWIDETERRTGYLLKIAYDL